MIIYKTTNLVNGKFYIGKDSHNDKNYLGSGTRFEKAVTKYGKGNFKKATLEYCTKENLNEREIYWIAELHACDPLIGYNILPGGEGCSLCGDKNGMWGKKQTVLTKETLRLSKLGDKNPNYGKPLLDSVKKLIGIKTREWWQLHPYTELELIEMGLAKLGDKNPRYGKPLLTTTKELISIKNKEWRRLHPYTELELSKRRIASTGRPGPNKGKIFSAATCEYMRLAALKRYANVT